MTNDLTESTEQSGSTNVDKPRPSWDVVWMRMANLFGQRSLCDRAKVGCVLVDEDHNILAASYNGPPPGYEVEGTCRWWCPRAMGMGNLTNDYSNCPSNHAEINAISRMRPGNGEITAYINRFCCHTCAKALASAGISRVVCLDTSMDKHLGIDDTLQFLSDCGVYVSFLLPEDIAE